MHALRWHGPRIPEDVSVTLIRISVEDIGAAAVRPLLGRVAGEKGFPWRSIGQSS